MMMSSLLTAITLTIFEVIGLFTNVENAIWSVTETLPMKAVVTHC